MRRPDPTGLERRITVHDRRHFELKLEYEPEEREEHTTYLVEAYVCLPGSLNVTEETVPRDTLYADILNYIRLKTPEQSWIALATAPGSPLVRAAEELRAVEQGGPTARFRYETKLFACVFRVAVADLVDELAKALGRKPGRPEVEDVGARFDAAIADIRPLLAKFRALRPRVDRTEVAQDARIAFYLADEWASVSFEQRLRRLIVRLSRGDVAPEAAEEARELKSRALNVILEEERHRHGCDYRSILDPATDNERYVSRAGLLKKYCSSALFLTIDRRGAPRRWLELAFATAAGLAMATTLIVTFWAQARYAKVSFQLFGILVIAYMLKDRVKELARQRFATALQRRLWDRRVLISDPVGEKLGQLREKIRYEESEALPKEARQIRRLGKDDAELEAEEELRETIIHYKKQIELQPSDYFLRRGGGGGVTDIVRFNVERWLRDMDERYESIEFMDRTTGTLSTIRAAKVYKVDVVFRFQVTEEETPATTLLRLVLDRRGIKRIERFEGDGRTSVPRMSMLP